VGVYVGQNGGKKINIEMQNNIKRTGRNEVCFTIVGCLQKD
jgi:hypothetical protein